MNSEKVEKGEVEEKSYLDVDAPKVWHKPVMQKLDVNQTANSTFGADDGPGYS